MRSFQQVVVFLFALLVCALAEDNEAYDSTVYITSTVYRVNTVTMSGPSPSSAVANRTSTIPASHVPTYPAAISSLKTNGTSFGYPSGTGTGAGVKPMATQFTGAASSLNINAYVAALAAGVGYFVL